MPESPGRNQLQKPPSLQELANRDKDHQLCLFQPYPYRKGCTQKVDIGDVARQQLGEILGDDHLIQNGDLRRTIARLTEIAESFCCPKHWQSLENPEDFAHYWVVFELIDTFLQERKWSWDNLQWQCLVSDCDTTCDISKVAERHMVYRSFYQIVMYTAFPDDLSNQNESLLRNAIENLVKRWRCSVHKKSTNIMESLLARLEEDIRHTTGPNHRTQNHGKNNYLSPNPNGRGTQSGADRRRSAPLPLPSSIYTDTGTTTPNRPLPVRSTASDTSMPSQFLSIADSPLRDDQTIPSPIHTPTIKTPTVSSFPSFKEVHGEKRKPRQIVNDVLRIIEGPARSGPKNKGALYHHGWIYILRIKEQPGYVKVGRTKQSVGHREKQIASCGLTLEVVGGEHETRVPYHERLEDIIHADLYNERHFFQCSCSRNKVNSDSHVKDSFTEHSEWFKIEEEEVIQKVHQWMNWIRQEPQPYKKPGTPGEGALTPDYKRRVTYCFNNDLVETEERWKRFMTPFYMDRVD